MTDIKRIDCNKNFRISKNDIPWLPGGLNYPACFDWGKVTDSIGGLVGGIGHGAMIFQFIKCNERDNFVDNFPSKLKKSRCRSNRQIKKWLDGKVLALYYREKWIDFKDYVKPVKSNFHWLTNENLSKNTGKDLILKKTKVSFIDSILNGFFPD